MKGKLSGNDRFGLMIYEFHLMKGGLSDDDNFGLIYKFCLMKGKLSFQSCAMLNLSHISRR